jgi:hypothetical protein
MFGAKNSRPSRKAIFLLATLLMLVSAAAIVVRSQPSALPAQQPNALKGVSGQVGGGAEEAQLYAADPSKVSGESAELLNVEDYWYTRVSYPTGKYDNKWLIQAAQQDSNVAERVPAGRVNYS